MLKYAVDERAGFEKSIDENPLDATTHLVYADWLDDNGHHDEAAFRRSMGKWAQAHHEGGTDPEWRTLEKPAGSSWHAGLRRKHLDDLGEYLGLPDGVRPEHLGPALTTADWDRDWSADPPEAHRPTWISTDHADAPVGWQWDTYRGMEEAFRRAFKAGKSS